MSFSIIVIVITRILLECGTTNSFENTEQGQNIPCTVHHSHVSLWLLVKRFKIVVSASSVDSFRRLLKIYLLWQIFCCYYFCIPWSGLTSMPLHKCFRLAVSLIFSIQAICFIYFSRTCSNYMCCFFHNKPIMIVLTFFDYYETSLIG